MIPAVVTGEARQRTSRSSARPRGGGADVALDLLGAAKSTSTTLSCLRALKRGGRLVLMGSAEVPLELSFREMLANDWEVVGQFMYDRSAPGQLAALAAEGLLDLGKIVVTTFALDRLQAGGRGGGLDAGPRSHRRGAVTEEP